MKLLVERMLSRRQKPVYLPQVPDSPMETEEPQVNQETGTDAEETSPVPPGVLGYAVGVFPPDGEHCSGLTHTGLMELGSARREAASYAAGARNDPYSPRHAGCRYRPVEIREVSSSG